MSHGRPSPRLPLSSPKRGPPDCCTLVFDRFQEIVDLNAGSLLVEHQENVPWEIELQQLLADQFPDTPYVQVRANVGA